MGPTSTPGESEIWNRESGNLGSRNRTIPASQNRNHKPQIGQSEGSTLSAARTRLARSSNGIGRFRCGCCCTRGRCKIGLEDPWFQEPLRIVQFEVYDFGFEMQESYDFEIPDFLIPDFRFPMSASPLAQQQPHRNGRACHAAMHHDAGGL